MNSNNSVASFTSIMDFEVNELDWQLMTMIDFEAAKPDWLSTMIDFELYITDWQLPTTIMKFELDQTPIQFAINSLIDNEKDDNAAAGTTEEPLVDSHHEDTGVASLTKSSTDLERLDSDWEIPDGLNPTKDDVVKVTTEEALVNSHHDAVELCPVDAILKMHFLLSCSFLFYTFTNSLLSFFDENQPQVLDELTPIVCDETVLNSVSSFGVDEGQRIDEVIAQEPVVETIPIDHNDIPQQVIKTRYGRVVQKPVRYTDLTFCRRQQTCAGVLETIGRTRYGRTIRKPAYYSECGFC